MTQRQYLAKWEAELDSIRKLKTVANESPATREKRVASLLDDFVAFSRYYFPEYASSDFAKFHLDIAADIIENDELYLVAALPREHGKSVLLGLLIPAFLMFRGDMHNMLLISHNKDNAIELLMPLIANLETNQRIINDFGEQKGFGSWEEGKWRTKSGCSMRAIGAQQSPRGTRNDEKRPDLVLIDDIDTDEEARNQTRINKKWAWIEQALFPTMSISGSKRFIFAGNIISKESCIVKASIVADKFYKVQILDEEGKPSWSRYTLDQVNYMLSKISYASGQKEYFNNPINEGTVFNDITYGKVPPLEEFKFLVNYCDPSYKDSRKNDFKSVNLLGRHKNGNVYVIKPFLLQTTKAVMIQAFYDHDVFVAGRTAIYHYIECGGLQDTYYQELFIPLLIAHGNRVGKHLSISPDHRKKPDKFTRIESTLEPLNRQGRLIFNEALKNDPHMRRLEEQFLAIEPSLPAHDDGPDCVEGGVHIINNKLVVFKVKVGSRKRNTKRY